MFFWRANFVQRQVVVFPEQNLTEAETDQKQENKAESRNDNNVEIKNDKQFQAEQIKQTKVPFTSQAPLGDWSDLRNQNGCEEASVAMAMRWVKDKTFSSPSDAQQEIFDIAKFEEKAFGTFVDATVADVGKILTELYGFKNFAIKEDIVLDDLKNELEKGSIILVPAYGRALKNPYYTQPGPITHMLVLVGYDQETKEFITNDPGTKRGNGYRYNEKVLFDAVWAYPGGQEHSQPPKSTERKSMLIIMHN